MSSCFFWKAICGRPWVDSKLVTGDAGYAGCFVLPSNAVYRCPGRIASMELEEVYVTRVNKHVAIMEA